MFPYFSIGIIATTLLNINLKKSFLYSIDCSSTVFILTCITKLLFSCFYVFWFLSMFFLYFIILFVILCLFLLLCTYSRD